jgi:hypothetical protein
LVWQDATAAAPAVLSLVVVILGTQGLAIGALQMIRARGGDRVAVGMTCGAINLIFGLLLLQTISPTILMAPQLFGPLLLLQGVVLIVWAALAA